MLHYSLHYILHYKCTVNDINRGYNFMHQLKHEEVEMDAGSLSLALLAVQCLAAGLRSAYSQR